MLLLLDGAVAAACAVATAAGGWGELLLLCGVVVSALSCCCWLCCCHFMMMLLVYCALCEELAASDSCLLLSACYSCPVVSGVIVGMSTQSVDQRQAPAANIEIWGGARVDDGGDVGCWILLLRRLLWVLVLVLVPAI